MSAPHDPYDPELDPPTTPLPPAPPGASRHRAPDDGRRWVWAAVAGAVVAVVAAAVMVTSADDGGPGGSGPAAAVATPDDTATEDPEALVLDEASPFPTASPSPRPSPQPRVRPADLVAGLQTTVKGLVQQRELRRDAGKDLARRLREVEQNLADGDVATARTQLRQFAERLVSLRNENRISSGAYDTLAGRTTQLVQALPGS